MIATTPSGTRTFSMRSPFGRVQPSTTSPTGSGRAATWRSPPAIPSIRAGLRRSRSTTVGVTPPAWAAATSADRRVRRQADLVAVRVEAQQRWYQVRADKVGELRTALEEFWGDRLGTLKAAAEAMTPAPLDRRPHE